jgi:hypothetical protein
MGKRTKATALLLGATLGLCGLDPGCFHASAPPGNGGSVSDGDSGGSGFIGCFGGGVGNGGESTTGGGSISELGGQGGLGVGGTPGAGGGGG